MNDIPLSYGDQVKSQKNRTCLTSFGQFLKKVNPCLRPEVESESLTSLLNNFEQLSIYEDPYYGEAFLLESKTMNGELLLLKKQKVQENDITQRQNEIREISSYNGNNHVLKQTQIEKLHKMGFLWSKYELYITYDYIFIDLEKEFEYRILQKNRFSESEIISIMKGTCKGLIHLELTDYASIRMQYIYFSKSGVVKVAHPDMFRYKSNLENICENDQEKGIYLSPEEIQYLERGEKNAILGWKSNSFTFGMVFLSLMANHNLNEIYDYSACTWDEEQTHEIIRNCKQIYPEGLVNIVERMIVRRPEDRLSLRSVLNKLNYKLQTDEKINIELIEDGMQDKQEEYYEYLPKKQEKQHPNYLRGLVFPKVGLMGEYYDDKDDGTTGDYRARESSQNNDSITAQERYFYTNSKNMYIGEGINKVKKGYNNSRLQGSVFDEKPTREGKGLYTSEQGKQYLGQWQKGQMQGFGKLFWNNKDIWYVGQFQQGKFNGRGTEYNGKPQIVGHADSDDEPDETFVRMQKDNWQKYEGNFKNDKRQGQGIVYFRSGRWMGNFREGQPNGEGVFIDNNGHKTKGIWKDGQLQN